MLSLTAGVGRLRRDCVAGKGSEVVGGKAELIICLGKKVKRGRLGDLYAGDYSWVVGISELPERMVWQCWLRLSRRVGVGND